MEGIWLSKLQIQISFDPAELHLGIYLLDISALVKIFMFNVFSAALQQQQKKGNNLNSMRRLVKA